MPKFGLTNKAVADLNGIWEYTVEKWSEKQADKYYRELMGCCQKLADNPALGKTYEGISPTLSGFRLNKHIIFFRKTEPEFVEITRILHERMDLKSRLEE